MHQSLMRLLIPFLAVTLFVVEACADPIPVGSNGVTVTCEMSDGSACVQVGNNPLKWVIAEATDDMTDEPGIVLTFFGLVFPKLPGTFNILDPVDANGNPCPQTNYPLSCISDQVGQVNFIGDTPRVEVTYFSDPNIDIVGDINRNNIPVGCVEDAVSGCSFSFVMKADNINLTFTLSSDADFPTPGGSITSDTMSVVSEPPASLMFCTMLGMVVLAALRSQRIVRLD